MKILDRYIGKQVIVTILIVTVALLGVDVFFYFVNELRSVGKGDYTFNIAVMFMIFTLPRRLYIIFPWAALLGSLVALGNLGKHSELVAMRAATVSVTRIAWAALKAGMLLTLIMFICGEVISPYADNWAQNKKTQAISKGQALETQFGTWIRHNNEFIHVGAAQNSKQLQDITRYDFDQEMLLETIEHIDHAEKMNGVWELSGIRGSSFINGTVLIENSAHKIMHDLLDSDVLQTAKVKHLECLTLVKLWRVMKSRVAQDLNAVEYQRAFWLKMMQPVAALVMVFLAVPFAFGPLRSASMGLKVVIGVLVGFAFHTLNSIFGPLTAVTGLSPMLAAMIPAAVFFIFGYYMLLRVR